MIVVLFEVRLKENSQSEYFKISEYLKDELEQINGFISVERFKSIHVENKFLSLSFWRNQEAIEQWNLNKKHNLAQKKGKEKLFESFGLRTCQIINERTNTM